MRNLKGKKPGDFIKKDTSTLKYRKEGRWSLNIHMHIRTMQSLCNF